MAGTSGSHDGDLNSLIEQAVLAHREGRLDAAIAIYEQALAGGVQSAELYFNLAIAHHGLGRLGPAIASMRRSVALSPLDPALHNNLGGMLLEDGEQEAAASAFTAALDIDPNHHSALFNLGNLEQKRGRLEAAARCFRRIIDHHGAVPDTVNNLAVVLIALGDTQGAIPLLEATCVAHPDARSFNNLGLALRAAGQLESAAAAFHRALSLAPEFADAQTNFGNLLLDQGDGDGALVHLRRATQIAPDNAHFQVNLGNALLSIGCFSEAETVLQRAAVLAPAVATAKRHLALIAKRGNLPAHVAECNALLEQANLPESERTHLYFALGKLHDDLCEYELAFEHYQRANTLVRKTINFSAEAFTRCVDATLDCFNETLLAGSAAGGHPSPRPVFVVGLPRSGTSLVEQVLASHSQVAGAGELRFFAELEGRLAHLTGEPYPSGVSALGVKQRLGLAAEYLGILDACDHSSRYVIDKLPGNALRLGLIQLVLPNARVIYCTRDDRDVGLSNYFQYFTGRQDFAYDLYEIGITIRLHERVMAHWYQQLTLPILEMPYERMVDDLESSTRGMLEFLDLPYEPRCLEFHHTQRTVRTASSWQVRQPLYSSAVGRWCNYAKHLSALKDGLKL